MREPGDPYFNFTDISAKWKRDSEALMTGLDFVLVQNKSAWAIVIGSASQNQRRKEPGDWTAGATTRAGVSAPKKGEARLMPENILCWVMGWRRLPDGRLSIHLEIYLLNHDKREWDSIRERKR